MATWQADIKVVPTGSFFKVTVEAGSAGTAQETIQAIYHPLYIHNLRQISSRSISNSSQSIDIPGSGWLVGILVLIFIVYHWWYIVVPLALIPFLWGFFFD